MGTNTPPVVGVIGLGDIGRGVATNLEKSGTRLVVYDVRTEAADAFAESALIASDPAELGANCGVIAVAVVDDEQVLAVLVGTHGALSTTRPGSTVLILSTVSPETVRHVAQVARTANVDVLDCAVSGGPVAAAEGSLVAMLGGDEVVIDRMRPILAAFTSKVVHMGPLGAGLQAKLARNLVQYGSWLAAYEAQLLAEAAGIDLLRLAEVIRASDQKIGGSSRLMFRSTATPFGPSDDSTLVGAMKAAAALAHKDLRAALDLADQLGVHLPLAAMTEKRADAMFGVGKDVDTKSGPRERR